MGFQMLAEKIFSGKDGARVAVVQLGQSVTKNIQLQLSQDLLINRNIVVIKINIGVHHINFPMGDIFHRGHPLIGGFPEPFGAFNSTGNGSQPCFQFRDLLPNLFFLPDQGGFDQLNVPLLQNCFDLPQTHPQLLHILDHIQPGFLINTVVAVTAVLINMAGL